MKKINIQFKAIVGFVIQLLLACSVAVSVSAPTPAIAGEMVPFDGTVAGYGSF